MSYDDSRPAGSGVTNNPPSDAPTKAQEEVRDFIYAQRDKGNVVVMGLEGLMSMPLEEFVKQPADGILYDLNRLEEVVATFIHDRKWVNDFAVAATIRKLKELADKVPAELYVNSSTNAAPQEGSPSDGPASAECVAPAATAPVCPKCGYGLWCSTEGCKGAWHVNSRHISPNEEKK